MLVGTIYELDGGWYTSKSSNRLVKEIYEFWANPSCPDDSTAQPLAGPESKDMGKTLSLSSANIDMKRIETSIL